MQPGVVPGAVLELHAAKALSGTGPQVNSPLGTQWFDTSGNGNHGTLTSFSGTPWAGSGAPSDPYRLVSDGINDYVDCGDKAAFDFATAFTLEIELDMPSDTPNAFRGIIAKLNDSTFAAGFDLGLSNGRATMSARGSSAISTGESGTPVRGRGGTHLTFTVTTSAIWRYIDGAADVAPNPATGTWTSVVPTGYPLRIGRRGGGSTYLPAVVSLVRLYPFALTPAQVAQNYNAGPLWAPAVSGLPVIGSPIVQGMRV